MIDRYFDISASDKRAEMICQCINWLERRLQLLRAQPTLFVSNVQLMFILAALITHNSGSALAFDGPHPIAASEASTGEKSSTNNTETEKAGVRLRNAIESRFKALQASGAFKRDNDISSVLDDYISIPGDFKHISELLESAGLHLDKVDRPDKEGGPFIIAVCTLYRGYIDSVCLSVALKTDNADRPSTVNYISAHIIYSTL